MKKLLIYLIIATGVLLNLSSCSKNNLVVDKDVVPPPSFVKFNTNSLLSTYYIKSTNAPYKLPIGITTLSDKDRTINLSYSSSTGAASGVQYTAPASIIIKAGKTLDSLSIAGIFSGYPTSSRIDSLKIKITSSDVPVGDYNNEYVLLMRKYCDVIGADLVGDFTRSTDTYNGGASSKPNYTATVSNWTAVSATSATVIIKNLGATSDNGWGPFGPTDGSLNPGLTATVDWSNPANFSVTIAKQNYFNDGSGNSTITATGTFSSCDQTFTITMKVTYAGNGSTYTTVCYLRR